MTGELTASDAQIQRILQSKAFRTSELQRNLLVYLAERSAAGTDDQLKEYTIGLEVFGKPDSYDPRQESVVRMHAARLRQKLTDYYRTEGVDDPIVVDMPKGAFKLTFTHRAPAVAPEPPVPQSIPEPRAEPIESLPAPVSVEPAPVRRRWKVALAGTLAAGLFVGAVWTGWLEMRPAAAKPVTAAGSAWTPELRQLWAPLLDSNRPLMVCLATPSNGVTGAGTATGAFLLGQFLAQRKENVLLTRSDLLSVPELMIHNVVFLGSTVGIRQVQGAFTGEQLVLEQDGIRNLSPRPGEPALIADRTNSSTADDESYALITYVPGLHGNGESLYLSGNQISSVMAGVQAFTDPAIARSVVSKLKRPDGNLPRSFQVVLKVSTMDSMPFDISYFLHRELSLSGH